MTGAAINTLMKLLVDAGRACAAYQDEHLRGLSCRRVQCDEIWSFAGAKAQNLRDDERGKPGRGDAWTWTANDANSKPVPCWLVATRPAMAAGITDHLWSVEEIAPFVP